MELVRERDGFIRIRLTNWEAEDLLDTLRKYMCWSSSQTACRELFYGLWVLVEVGEGEST